MDQETVEYYLNTSLGRFTNVVARAMSRDLNRRFAGAGLNVTMEQWQVLVNLGDTDGLTQREISERLLNDKTCVSRLIDGLEKRNLVVRIPDQLDGRQKRVFLTYLGKSLQETLVGHAKETLSKAQEGIPQEDLETCRRVLQTMAENLQR